MTEQSKAKIKLLEIQKELILKKQSELSKQLEGIDSKILKIKNFEANLSKKKEKPEDTSKN